MIKITLEATKEEFDQLAIMAYLAQYVVDSSGKYGTGYKYPKMEEYLSMLRKLNKEILLAMPDSEMVQANELHNRIFVHTIETENQCQLLKETFEKSGYLESVCTEISRRDFIEQGGDYDNATSIVSEVFLSIYESNMRELEEFGLSRFKIIE
jgi:ferritin-like metal-binding protein YciE